MEHKDFQERLRGSLIGGAIGDALGYPVEFIDSFEDIQSHYGQRGITRLDTSMWGMEELKDGKAVVSDDTQMTLFTACGLLNAQTTGFDSVASVCHAYIEWLFTQKRGGKSCYQDCWIRELPEMNVCRAPGNTCLMALDAILQGRKPSNDSKGCGGVMRIAPVALYGAVDSRISNIEQVDMLAADVSRLTHLHPLGYIPSALTAHVIYRLAQDENPTRDACLSYIDEGLAALRKIYPAYTQELDYFIGLVRQAVKLSAMDADDVVAIETYLGGGWVAEETVAIALYCVLKYFGDFEQTMVASVNHAGDSDSTGAVAGNILGAAVGYSAIPDFYKEKLELHDVILHIADDLWRGANTPYLAH